MLILYYPPFRAEDDGELEYQTVVALQDYLDDLCEFSAETLADGWREARRAHKVERWPTIQAIRDACLAQRKTPVASSTVSVSTGEIYIWQIRVDGWMMNKAAWISSWGSAPDQHDTIVPQVLLDRYGIVKKAPPQRRSELTTSAVSRLREAMNGHEVPLFADESETGFEKRRMRADSIERANNEHWSSYR